MLKRTFVAVLLIAVCSGAAVAQSTCNQALYNVRAYGTAGDGKSLDSPFINKPIEACAQAGGGTGYLPAGTYLSASNRLESNINLFIDAGAVILGAPQEMNGYGSSEPFPDPLPGFNVQ